MSELLDIKVEIDFTGVRAKLLRDGQVNTENRLNAHGARACSNAYRRLEEETI